MQSYELKQINTYWEIMLTLFNEPNSTSLLSFITEKVKSLNTEDNNSWIFYAITCYFNPKTFKNLIAELKKILGNKLSGVHILIDSQQWVKKGQNKDDYIKDISANTQIPSSQITLTPIDYQNKLFHAKGYAMISSLDTSVKNQPEGFAIITSGNLTKSGLNSNIELGKIVYDSNSLEEFMNIFFQLQNNYSLSPQKEAELRKYQIIAKGTFYHKWHPTINLKIELELSSEEKKRLYELTNNEETRKKLEIFKLQKQESITDDPINIESVFDICPEPIPASIWANYSIDTLLGQWMPSEISKLIEEEVEESKKILKPLLQEIGDSEKIAQYTREFNEYVDCKMRENFIEFSTDNLFATKKWQERVTAFFADDNLLNVFICDYEKINVSVNKIKFDLIKEIHNRIQDFYYSPNRHIGLGRTFANLKNESKQMEFDKEISEVKEKLKRHRLGALYYELQQNNQTPTPKNTGNKRLQPGDIFIAFEIINNNEEIKYERLDGVFIRLDKSHEDGTVDTLIYKTSESSKEKSIAINKLRTFKKQWLS
ncbi:hypothetical protein H6G12_06460 [Aphanizomenon flos-aquae FACHB-1171]|nr:hypothetical protein [Aphanizomenon flos-aquae FACHB-1171]